MTDGLAKQRMPLALALVVMLVGDLAFEGLARSAVQLDGLAFEARFVSLDSCQTRCHSL